jgi:hypothetical protein
MVIGDNPTEIVEKYGAEHKVEPYVKYKYLSANKYQENAIKVLSSILDKFDTLGLTPAVKESLKLRLETLKKLTPFEYYRELTDGMYYDENGNALSEENPDKKYNTCRIGRNFALPLILKDGTETYSALSKDVDWNTMNSANKEAYEAAWELVVDGREPTNDQEKTIYESMKDKEAYFSKFKSKEAYVAYNTNYWNYAYADKDGWVDVDDDGNDEKWILEYYDRFIAKLKPTDLVTIFECSTNDG